MLLPLRRVVVLGFFLILVGSVGFVGGAVPASQVKPDPKALKLFVSPVGNDAWSGRLAASNVPKTDGPLATIEKARDRIRELKTTQGGLKQPVTVLLRGGVYPLSKELRFTDADSGTEACPITYQAYPGEKPVLSGGMIVKGWQPDDSNQSETKYDGKLWRADLSEVAGSDRWDFNQLFVDGRRRQRARIPNRGTFLRSDGLVSRNSNREFRFKPGDLKQWDRLQDVIAVVYHSWETSIHHIESVDTQTRRVIFHEPAPWSMGRWEKQQRYYIENVFEGLDEPGEWYWNRETRTLYYYPLPGEKRDRVEVVVPQVISTLVRFDGDPAKGKFVEHLRFRGISFQHTNANLKTGAFRNPGQGEIYQPALIMAIGLRNSVFESCEVAHAGAHAIWMASGSSNNKIERCHLHDLAGGGVYIGGGWGIQSAVPVDHITVDNCFIHDGGHLFHGAHGVWIGKSSYNKVTHSEISNFDYTAIACGWSWGFQPSSAHHNNLDYNHIHHLSNGEGLSDMGGIYTLGVSPGTTERYNHMHDIYNYAHVSHGSGIYPDEGSSEILIENNVVYRVATCPLFQHYGKDNTVRNNILAFGGEGQLRRCREDKPCHYIAEGNIIYSDTPQMFSGRWKNGDWKLGRNVYWSTGGKPDFMGMDLETWSKKTKDVGSIVADPLFVDPANGDFCLKKGSPAVKLGFKPIDLSKTGLYGDPSWVNLPKRYKDRARNDIPKPEVKPLQINFDFEGEGPGEQPLEGRIVTGENDVSLVVSKDTAAKGTQSLKFTDAPGQKWSWTPHLFYHKTCEKGQVQLSWDMLNSKERPARFNVELREYPPGGSYITGPTVLVTADGTITANGRKFGTIPLGAWVHVDVRFELGKGAPKNYQITLAIPGHDPIVAAIPFSVKFTKITWLGICSLGQEKAEFYLDNLKLWTVEELANGP